MNLVHIKKISKNFFKNKQTYNKTVLFYKVKKILTYYE